MRYMIYADPHWSVYSSILRSRGNKDSGIYIKTEKNKM